MLFVANPAIAPSSTLRNHSTRLEQEEKEEEVAQCQQGDENQLYAFWRLWEEGFLWIHYYKHLDGRHNVLKKVHMHCIDYVSCRAYGAKEATCCFCS